MAPKKSKKNEHTLLEKGPIVSRTVLKKYKGMSEAYLRSIGVTDKKAIKREQKRRLRLMTEKRKLKRRLAVDKRIEPTTGLHNEFFFKEFLRHRKGAADRYPAAEAVSVVVFDMDHFKEYNDSYGHDAGTNALKRFSRILSDNIREEDVGARIGGDEFAIVVDGGMHEAKTVAKRITKEWDLADIKHDKSPTGKSTLSVGIARYRPGVDHKPYIAADEAMYKSKKTKNAIHAVRFRKPKRGPDSIYRVK